MIREKEKTTLYKTGINKISWIVIMIEIGKMILSMDKTSNGMEEKWLTSFILGNNSVIKGIIRRP